jgi:DNA-binding transcriptional regulator YhcF (GntR family)
MQFLLDKNQKEGLFEQAHVQLLSALHTGKLSAGDRLPSVRQVALRNGVNIKTVFAIYQRLHAEGYIVMRQGSGAYVSEIDQTDLEQAYSFSILKLIKAHLSDAERLRVPPTAYARLVQSFVDTSQTLPVKLAVVECNEEQVGVFADEISRKVRITVYPLLLNELESPGRKTANALTQVDYFATTHFHFKQVRTLTTKYQKGLFKLRLNPAFVPSLVDAAHKGTLLMIVSNTDYFPAFLESLINIGTPPKIVRRIQAVEYSNLKQVRKLAQQADFVYLSPLCGPDVRTIIPPDAAVITFESTLSPESLEMLQSALIFGPHQLQSGF